MKTYFYFLSVFLMALSVLGAESSFVTHAQLKNDQVSCQMLRYRIQYFSKHYVEVASLAELISKKRFSERELATLKQLIENYAIIDKEIADLKSELMMQWQLASIVSEKFDSYTKTIDSASMKWVVHSEKNVPDEFILKHDEKTLTLEAKIPILEYCFAPQPQISVLFADNDDHILFIGEW